MTELQDRILKGQTLNLATTIITTTDKTKNLETEEKLKQIFKLAYQIYQEAKERGY